MGAQQCHFIIISFAPKLILAHLNALNRSQQPKAENVSFKN